MKKIFLKIFILLGLILSIINANTLNLTNGTYEATPSCNVGIYNPETGGCESPISCLNGGTIDSNGNCSSPALSEIFDAYELLINKSEECKIANYEYKNKITEETKFYDKQEVTSYIAKIESIDSVNANKIEDFEQATGSCPAGYTMGGITEDIEFCEYEINSNQCPSGLTYNTTLNKCEDYDNGYSTSGIGQVVDYTNKITTTVYEEQLSSSICGQAGNGLYYDCGQYAYFGSAKYGSNYYNYVPNDSLDQICSAKGMRLPFINETTAGSSSGVPSFNGWTWTNSWYWSSRRSWSGSSIGIQTSRTFGLRCVTNQRLTEKVAVTTSVCPTGYTATTGAETSKGECKKTVSFNYYDYTCPNGYTISNDGFSSYSKTDTNTTTDNSSTLGSAVNSSSAPTNNCYKSAQLVCSNGGSIKDISSTKDICSLNTQFNCPAGTSLNMYACVTTSYSCDLGYELNPLNNKCENKIYTCPTGYEDNGGLYCSKKEMICPEGSVEVTGEIKSCKKTIPAYCPLGFENDPTNNTKCRKEIFNPECKISAFCKKLDNVCSEGSYPSNDGLYCISKKEPTCDVGYSYNSKSGKCEQAAFCPSGYIDNGSKGCIRNYTYSIYTCPVGYIGPNDPGIDCQATCGSNGCSCNATTPPANNCKKEYSLNGDEIEIIKKRELITHYVSGSVTPKEYGVYKNFDCGENCLFTIEKIVGKDDTLCFYKENGEEQCIKINGCGFKGEITNNTYPNDLFDLNLDSQYILSLGNINPEPALSNNVSCPIGSVYNSSIKYCEADTGNACPSGSVYNSKSNVCDRIVPTPTNRSSRVGEILKTNDTWNGLNWGSNRTDSAPLGGYGGCAGAGARNISVKYINDNNIQLTYTLFSDYQDAGSKTVTVSRTSDYKDTYVFGRDAGRIRIDFKTGIVYSGHCRADTETWSARYTLEGLGTMPFNCSVNQIVKNGKCITRTTPTCAEEGFEWSNISRNCYKSSEFQDSQIESTCKMNGHVGWHSRDEGIISIIKDPNNSDRILFWDSYKDKDIGFIEFIKDVKEEDKSEGYIPENNFLYQMLGKNFTASESIDGNTLFVSSKIISDGECINIATENGLVKASLVSESTKELIKKLSGDRYQIQYQDPVCTNGIYLSSINKCVSSINDTNTICTNGKYDRINLPSESSNLLKNYAIWDNSQGDNIEVSTGFYATYSGMFNINIATMGNAQMLIDGALISYVQASSTKETTQRFYMSEGLHEIKIIARKDTLPAYGGSIIYGSRGFAVTISDESNNLISSSNNWCKNTSTTTCPTEGFVKVGNLCLETSYAHCPYGNYDIGIGQCVLMPKCILAKAGEETYKEQKNAIKKETRLASEMAFKCSPLSCSNSQCQVANCPIDSNGIEYQGTVISAGEIIENGTCTDQSCDANKSYYEYCGKNIGCDTTNPLIYEDTDGTCKELYCATGYIMDTTTKRCKKLECPEGTTLQTDGSCLRN